MADITLKDVERKAISEYRNADASGKKALEAVFGSGLFNRKLIGRLTTFRDVCEEAGINEADYSVPDSGTPEVMAAAYFKRLQLVAKVFNEGWRPDLSDTSQYKYYPWFYINPYKEKLSGFGLSYYDGVYDGTGACLGVRLYYRNSETAVYVGKTFICEYEAYYQYLNQCD